MTRLRELNLGSTRVTDGCVAPLQALPGLRKLLLAQTAVTNGFLERYDVGRLEELSLHGTTVTDEGLERLRACCDGYTWAGPE